jgi:hypothetical protein
MPLLVAALLEKGLGLLGNAVLAKGKDVIEKELGIDLETAAQTPEGLQKLKQLEIDHEQYLLDHAIKKAELELKDKVLDISNTTNARDANAKIQESANASTLAKNAPYIMDFFIVGGTMLLAYFIFFIGIPPQNKDIAFAAFGSLLTLCGTIVNFHRGSSSSSKDKDALLSAMHQQGAPK